MIAPADKAVLRLAIGLLGILQHLTRGLPQARKHRD